MRATLDIDADIMHAARVIAEAESKTLGQVLSELVRKGLAEAAEAPALAGEVGRSRERGDGSATVAADATRRKTRRR
jgi:hypothetical protein